MGELCLIIKKCKKKDAATEKNLNLPEKKLKMIGKRQNNNVILNLVGQKRLTGKLKLYIIGN